MAISTTLAHQILDAIFNEASFSYAAVYVSLHTGDPGTSGANEVTGGGYARKQGSYAVASGRQVVTDTQLEWLNMPGVTVSHVGIWSAITAGTFLAGGSLTASKTVPSGETFRILVGDKIASI